MYIMYSFYMYVCIINYYCCRIQIPIVTKYGISQDEILILFIVWLIIILNIIYMYVFTNLNVSFKYLNKSIINLKLRTDKIKLILFFFSFYKSPYIVSA